MEADEALSRLWGDAGCDLRALDRVDITGRDPVLPSAFRVGTAAAAAIAAAGLATAEIWRLRQGKPQRVSVDLRAAAAAIRSERYLRVDGGAPAPLWDEISGFYRTGDGRWLQLHTNFPHHRQAALSTLDCPQHRESVGTAVGRWSADALETALANAGGCGAVVRAPAAWRTHPQAVAAEQLPVLEVRRIDDSKPEPLPSAERPLSGLRVLDLTRVIAGPVCGRALAEQGATVLRIDPPHLPDALPLVMDVGRGKLSAVIDLRNSAGVRQIHSLIRRADIFVQAYRPGALAALGLSWRLDT